MGGRAEGPDRLRREPEGGHRGVGVYVQGGEQVRDAPAGLDRGQARGSRETEAEAEAEEEKEEKEEGQAQGGGGPAGVDGRRRGVCGLRGRGRRGARRAGRRRAQPQFFFFFF